MNILITGARSGIGYATALELLDRGHKVYLTVHTDRQLEEIQKEEVLRGKAVQFLKLDITNNDDRQKVRNLDIDVLINNAAIGNGGSIVEASMDKIRENYEVNVFGTIEMTQLYLKRMVEKDKGRIIMMSSGSAEMPFPWLGIYSSTKAAIKNIAIALDQELKEVKSNVKVVIIEPGFYFTGFNEVMLDNKYDDENSIFKDFREKIITNERLKIRALRSNDLKSIVDKIITAVEIDNPDLIYKAPFIQATVEKAYMIIKK